MQMQIGGVLTKEDHKVVKVNMAFLVSIPCACHRYAFNIVKNEYDKKYNKPENDPINISIERSANLITNIGVQSRNEMEGRPTPRIQGSIFNAGGADADLVKKYCKDDRFSEDQDT